MAARGINKVILVGNLGKDPETRTFPSGGQVCNLTIATNDSWKDKNTGERKERTEWHRVAMFNKLAEIAGQYLKKGQQVYIEGSLRTRKWQDNNGQDRYTTEIIADQMQMLGGGGGGGGSGGFDDQYASGGSGGYGQSPASAPRQQSSTPPVDPGFGEDDIPF